MCLGVIFAYISVMKQGGFGEKVSAASVEASIQESEVPVPAAPITSHATSPEPMSAEEVEDAWKSINLLLCQNKCWLCENTFARGKTKKVFLVEHLLQYLEKRFLAQTQGVGTRIGGGRHTAVQLESEDEKSEPKTELIDVYAINNSVVDNEKLALAGKAALPAALTANLLSRNLRNCWQAFCALNGDKENLATTLQRVECEVWMSGLICARTKDCATEYLLLHPAGKVSSSVMNQSTEEMFDADGYSKNRKGNVFRDKNGNICPPGCDCDNPWQYIQAALIESSTLNLTIPAGPDDAGDSNSNGGTDGNGDAGSDGI